MTLSVALTWDGARWPSLRLPAAARAFLAPGQAMPPETTAAQLFATGVVKELRICWVPCLLGGEPTLPATSGPHGKRVPYRIVKCVPLGDHLGVIYRSTGR